MEQRDTESIQEPGGQPQPKRQQDWAPEPWEYRTAKGRVYDACGCCLLNEDIPKLVELLQDYLRERTNG